MAKVILQGMSDARGAQGGTVFSRSRFGAYIRSKVAPVQPRTTSQLNTRTLLATAARGWRTLTDAQRVMWNDAAALTSIPDSMGHLYNPTGFQLFLRCTLNSWYSTVATPPALLNTPGAPVQIPDAPTGMVVVSAVGPPAVSLNLTWTTPALATMGMLVFATPPLSAGISFFKPSAFRLISAVTDSSVAQPLSLDAAYIAVYGAKPAVGTKVAIRVTPLFVAGGQFYPNTQGQAQTIVTH